MVDAHSSGVVAEGRFAATGDGYDDAIDFVDGHSIETERAWVIEGKTRREIIRCLKRSIARLLFPLIRNPEPAPRQHRDRRLTSRGEAG